MQTPTIGRIVHYYPGTSDPTLSDREGSWNNNGAKVLPAIILQAFSPVLANLMVFTANGDAVVVRRYSVQEKSAILPYGDFQDGQEPSYWEWPPLVPAKAVPFKPMTDGTSGDTTESVTNRA